jgi:glycosyltransferase involved in cell wall biosynthesis
VTRIALLTEIPAPFRIASFNALARRDDVELEVVFLRERNPDRPYALHEDEWEFAHRVLPGVDLTVRGRWLVVNRGVAAALRGARPETVLLGGWNQPAFWQAALWARRHRARLVVWVESTLQDARSGRSETAKRLLARSADAFVVPGRAAAGYVEQLAPGRPVATAPNAVDTAFFAAELERRDAHRAALGITRPCALYVGRLAPEKGVDVLLEAVRNLDVQVLVAGQGPEETRLRGLAGANVRFLGNVGRDELPALYAAADVLCLPSRSEPWGFPLNEAAAAGLPLVATSAVGAAWDLIEDGENGYRVPAGDPARLGAALERVARRADRDRMGARSRELAARMTPEAWAEAVAALAAAAR